MISPLELALFVSLSAVAVGASLHAWRTQEAYGTFRFLGFESLTLLIVWNAHRWFYEAVSPLQVASWIVIAVATLLAANGVLLLRTVGRARHRVMEATEVVVEVGAYRYIRHPVYASLLLFGWGVFLKGTDLPSAALALAATAFWVATARREERFNLERFGATYSEYMRRTKMFVPFLL